MDSNNTHWDRLLTTYTDPNCAIIKHHQQFVSNCQLEVLNLLGEGWTISESVLCLKTWWQYRHFTIMRVYVSCVQGSKKTHQWYHIYIWLCICICIHGVDIDKEEKQFGSTVHDVVRYSASIESSQVSKEGRLCNDIQGGQVKYILYLYYNECIHH
jgi:hypothetical protein